MINLSLPEAQLFRILSDLFGNNKVMPFMSVMMVCGGELPNGYSIDGIDLPKWARANKCLFTIVDEADKPRLVFEFFSSNAKVIEVTEIEHLQYLKPLLKHIGIRYVTISNDEFNEILDPRSSLDFFSFLKAQVEDEDE